MSPKETLEKARELLSDESRWTKCSFSKANGKDVPIEEAESFCLIGAVMRAKGLEGNASKIETDKIQEEFNLLSKSLPYGFYNPIAYNDRSWVDHKAVLRVLDRAIDYAKEQEDRVSDAR